MESTAQEKEHKATAKRLADLRKQGIVMRSRDLSSALVIVSAALALFMISTEIVGMFKYSFYHTIKSIPDVVNDPDKLFFVFKKVIYGNFVQLVKLFSLIFIAAIFAPCLFGGWNFTWDVVRFNFGKINPLVNFVNLFNLKRISGDLARSSLQAFLLISACAIFFYHQTSFIFSFVLFQPVHASQATFHLFVQYFGVVAIVIAMIVSIDILYNYTRFQNQHKMSLQELKDEHEEAEGSAELKRKIRSTQFSILRQRLSQSVPTANVVVTNPTHYAVALKYDSKMDRAPKVIAKGKGLIAEEIKRLAIVNGIYLYQAPPLARAIFYTTKLNTYVKPELYMAVAIVLSYVSQLKNYQNGQGQLPNFVSEFDLPKEFIYKE
jgi:flagellar biosynthetic protein FlhB